MAPNTTALQNTTLLSEEFVPLVDGITLSAANSLAQTFAFTAASDPGAAALLPCWASLCLHAAISMTPIVSAGFGTRLQAASTPAKNPGAACA